MSSPDPRKILEAMQNGDKEAIIRMAAQAAAEEDEGKVPIKDRCRGLTAKGEPCKAKGNYKDGFCFKHAPIEDDRPRCIGRRVVFVGCRVCGDVYDVAKSHQPSRRHVAGRR